MMTTHIEKEKNQHICQLLEQLVMDAVVAVLKNLIEQNSCRQSLLCYNQCCHHRVDIKF